MREKLLECPFCGHYPYLSFNITVDQQPFVRCSNKDCFMRDMNSATPKNWNARPTLPPCEGLIERFRKAAGQPANRWDKYITLAGAEEIIRQYCAEPDCYGSAAFADAQSKVVLMTTTGQGGGKSRYQIGCECGEIYETDATFKAYCPVCKVERGPYKEAEPVAGDGAAMSSDAWEEYPANKPIRFHESMDVSHPMLFFTEDGDQRHIRLGYYDHNDNTFYESGDQNRLPWQLTVTKFFPIPYPKVKGRSIEREQGLDRDLRGRV